MNAPIAVRYGYGVFGAPFVNFTLTYDGPLPASANKPKNRAKWEIRQAIHPQMVDLWGSHPALQEIWQNRFFPKTGGAFLMQTHHQYGGAIRPLVPPIDPKTREIFDLCEPINKHGAWFRPLIRESYALHCGLKILFLRKEAPGKVYQAGDIDGRIKTLLDALAMPQHKEQIIEKGSETKPIYCLLEDDSLVSGLEIETERLLGAEAQSPDFVRLVINVDIRLRQARIYNQSFLG